MDQTSSPGFLYYSLDSKDESKNEPANDQSSDYLSFDTSNNQSQGSDVNRGQYNSPSTAYSPGNYRSPYKGNNQRWSNNRGGWNKGNNNSPRGHKQNFNNRRSFNNSNDHHKDKSDCSIFLHPSFTEDPWRNLEQVQQQMIDEVDAN